MIFKRINIYLFGGRLIKVNSFRIVVQLRIISTFKILNCRNILNLDGDTPENNDKGTDITHSRIHS